MFGNSVYNENYYQSKSPLSYLMNDTFVVRPGQLGTGEAGCAGVRGSGARERGCPDPVQRSTHSVCGRQSAE